MTVFLPLICIQAQEKPESPPPGKVSAKIYTHFNFKLAQQGIETAFEVKRAYFGYKRALNKHFSAEVKLDIGSIDDRSEYSLIHRYTYFKNACLSYENGPVKTWFGLMDMLQFKIQEDFWGYRYLYRSFMDEYRFGPSADLGVGIQWNKGRRFSADLILSNGEGYHNMQYDNIYKLGGGLTFNALDILTFRAYYALHTGEHPQMTLSGFSAIKLAHFRMGMEYNWQHNYQFYEGHNRYGYSLYATYLFSERWEIFARYDQLYSNILPEEEVPWNLARDGSALIAGIQFTPIPCIHCSLNYQDWVEYARNGISEPFLYLNFEVLF